MERTHLRFSKFHLPFFKKAGGLNKSKILVERTSRLITVTAGLLDHIQDDGICCRNCRCSLKDINTLQANSFSLQIIRSCRTALDSISDCIGYTQHSIINIIDATSCSIIVHSDIKCTAITVCKCNNRILISSTYSLLNSVVLFSTNTKYPPTNSNHILI